MKPWLSLWLPETVLICQTGLFSSFRTLTGNIAIEMGYAAGLHRSALFATGVISFHISLWFLILYLWQLQRKEELKMHRKSKIYDFVMKSLIWFFSSITLGFFLLVTLFIIVRGAPQVSWSFLTDIYKVTADKHGILPMMINT